MNAEMNSIRSSSSSRQCWAGALVGNAFANIEPPLVDGQITPYALAEIVGRRGSEFYKTDATVKSSGSQPRTVWRECHGPEKQIGGGVEHDRRGVWVT